MSPESSRLAMFAGVGVELEYMIVDARTLDIRPLSDELLRRVTGAYLSDAERGPFCWSNELVLHVIELKTNGPAPTLAGLAQGFDGEVRAVNEVLASFGACLLPTGMHPWMDPLRETRLWPHEYSPIYDAYHRIFGCQGHGWSNLQSLHLNLPFANDAEFARLHAAVRALLPILPALAASSPFVDGRSTGWLDNRLAVYRTNSARIPSITGPLVPEPIYSQAEYEREILERMYRDIAEYDPEGVLQDEFLNARGAIARFSRGSLEVRVLDMLECPQADLAVTHAIVETLRALVQERWQRLEFLQGLTCAALSRILLATAQEAEAALIDDRDFLRVFGLDGRGSCAAVEVWRHLAETLDLESGAEPGARKALRLILEKGPLARRLLRAAGPDPSRERLRELYAQLSRCLASGVVFEA